MELKMNGAKLEKGLNAVAKAAQENTKNYAASLARQFETEAQKNAPWTNRTGNARRHFFGNVRSSNAARTVVDVGGSAPNYKRSAHSSADYLEYLEFDHGKKYAVIEPLLARICGAIRNTYGKAALQGWVSAKLPRDAARARIRARKSLRNRGANG